MANGDRDTSEPRTDHAGRGCSPLDELDRQIQRGFLHSHTQSSSLYSDLFQVASTVYALVDLLVQRGLLSVDEVEEHVRAVQTRLSESDFGAGLQFTMQRQAGNKYTDHPPVLVDCAERSALCRSACCALEISLSEQDIREGVLRWDLARPYRIRHGTDNYCVHLDRESRTCMVHDARPTTCRTYSCAGDTRIWLDFERSIPNVEGIDALLSRQDQPVLIRAERSATIPEATSRLGPKGKTGG